MAYKATKSLVRGSAPPDSFLDELVGWGKTADDDIFEANSVHDVYSNVVKELGPWKSSGHRRAVMLEVMRVLAGIESTWRWNEGVDSKSNKHATPLTTEAGAWQVSADSMEKRWPELGALVQQEVGSTDPILFQRAMKENHPLAMEYIARLLRRTTEHNGPVKRFEINGYLSRDAVAEFLNLFNQSSSSSGRAMDEDCTPQLRGRL